MGKKAKLKKYEDAEEYAISLGVNLEDLDGFSVQHIFPRTQHTRRKYEKGFIEIDEYDNDLYDDDVARDTILNNNQRKFTERIPMSEMDELSAEDLVAYHKFLQDYREECQSETE